MVSTGILGSARRCWCSVNARLKREGDLGTLSRESSSHFPISSSPRPCCSQSLIWMHQMSAKDGIPALGVEERKREIAEIGVDSDRHRESKESKYWGWREGSTKCLLCEHEDLSSIPQNPYKIKKPSMAAHACHPAPGKWREEDLWGSLASLSNWITEYQVEWEPLCQAQGGWKWCDYNTHLWKSQN